MVAWVRQRPPVGGSALGRIEISRPRDAVSSPVIADSIRGLRLLTPFCRGITKSLDFDAALQPTFDRCSDEARR
jgi:hypothetical protein